MAVKNSVKLLKELDGYDTERIYFHEIDDKLEENKEVTVLGKATKRENVLMLESHNKLTEEEYKFFKNLYTCIKYKARDISYNINEMIIMLKIIKEWDVSEGIRNIFRKIMSSKDRVILTEEEAVNLLKYLTEQLEMSNSISDISTEIELHTFDDGLHEIYVFTDRGEIKEEGVYRLKLRESKYMGNNYLWGKDRDRDYYDLDEKEQLG